MLGATWSEIDLGLKLWTIPGERMKAGVEHRVPLAEPALALLRKMVSIRRGDFVFEGQSGRPLSNMAMVLRRMMIDAMPHGFRSRFRTWTAECTSTPHEVAEASLAHTQGDRVVAAYRRGDFFEKRCDLRQDAGREILG